MLAENNIVQVIVNQRYTGTGQTFMNVYHYLATNVTGTWTDPDNFADIAAEVYIGMNAVVGVFQSVGIAYDSADFANLSNGLDIAQYVPTVALGGAAAGDSEPLQVALTFRLNRATAATRNGSKRFGGISDSAITTPQAANLAGTANVVAVQDWLSEPIEVVAGGGDECTLLPIILRRAAVGVPPTVYSEVASAIFRGAGSQNSRKELL